MINKEELIKILSELDIPLNEGLSSKSNTNKFPRIVFWEYVWDELDASDSSYDTVVTYQISMHYKDPRKKEVLELRKKLHDYGLRPVIYHEHFEEKKEFHSFLSVEVLENLDSR